MIRRPRISGTRLWLTRLLLTLAGVLAAVLIAEAGLRLLEVLSPSVPEEPMAADTPPLHLQVDEPYLYGLNPDHPLIDSQGLRSDPVAIPKPPDVLRILILGDSVPFGMFVERHEAFPRQLQDRLRRHHGGTIEVVNAGVTGYSTYNEWQYFRTRGRDFQADVVILAFCFNDVANPRLHWNSAVEAIDPIPAAAIPNLEYDRLHAIPRLADLHRVGHDQSWRTWTSRSRLATMLAPAIGRILSGTSRNLPPTHITGEDTLSITVLEDPTTPEWLWLMSLMEKIRADVEAEGARLVVVLLPLAYQLDPAYPHTPQVQLAAELSSRGIDCIDLLDTFRQYRQDELFMMDRHGFHDIWHLTPVGHAVVAEQLQQGLERFFVDNMIRR